MQIFLKKIVKVSSGFTLLELIVSVAAIALMSTVLSQIFFTTLKTNTRTELLKEVKQNGDFAQESLTRLIQNAQSLKTICDTVGVESSSIEIINPDGNTTTLTCVDDGDVARMASVSASQTEYLTSTNVTLGANCTTSNFTFVCKGGTAVPNSLSISFTLSHVNYDTFSSTFQTTVTTRNVIR
ncbi:type II secretion system protein [Candidatus Woesebacteria bacterium]|nr:type II secretion system protein [Candidatus Woesebacteria bacterium]